MPRPHHTATSLCPTDQLVWRSNHATRSPPSGKQAIASGGVAAFGAIGEFEHGLVIMPSTGRPVTLPGEPVRWRVYPRSTYYQNHLHVIYENHFEVLSFNHDYFVDQETKIFGTI